MTEREHLYDAISLLCYNGNQKMIKKVTLPKSVLNFIEWLENLPDVQQMILFGSRAVGDNDERADVDLAISAHSLDRKKFARLRVEAYETRTLYWISLMHLEQTPNVLRKRIIEQGVVIYERKKAKRQFDKP